ncbi:chromosomal replication initiator protein DnaA [Patescibacteria group bacterium]
MVDNKQLWNSVLSEIESCVSRANFSTWFRNTFVVKVEDGVVYLGVPNEFVRDWLYNKYHKNILKSLRESLDGVRNVEYIIASNADRDASAVSVNTQTKGELPLHDLYIDKKDNLNPKYTFNSFVIGSFNDLAYAAAQAIIKSPGSVYNPFFIHGGTGLGKTHLIQAMGNYIKKEAGVNIYYTTSEKFLLDYVNSVQNDRTNQFKEKYRKYDVFIMDDIQFLSGKEKTQEELFHVFNSLYDNNKQIIFSSDKHPQFISGLEDRLKSRFSAGMIVDVGEPEYESRLAILKHKAKEKNFILDDTILDYIASLMNGNVRELEGILNSLQCQSDLKKGSISIEDVKQLVKNSTKPKKIVSIQDLVKIVSGFYNISDKDIYHKTRRKEIVRPRQIIMYILREDFNVSYPTIGQKLGGRDHTTVMHSCDKVRKDMKESSLLTQELEQIRTMI